MKRAAWTAWIAILVGAGCDAYAPPCGDGALDPSEECDDGNLASGDGCSANCVREPRCGDWIVDPYEDCDDGNTLAGDGCAATCVFESTCGDDVREHREECDDGNTTPSDGCSAFCVFEFYYKTTATWSFAHVGAPDVDRGCPAEVAAITVRSRALFPDDTPTGHEALEVFDCADGEGTTAWMFQGRYETVLLATDSAGAEVWAASLPSIVDLRTGDKRLATTFFEDGGHIAVTWDALRCDDVAISEVGLHVRASDGTVTETLGACAPGRLVSAPLAAGTYDLELQATREHNGFAVPVGDPWFVHGVVVEPPNRVTEVGVTLPTRATR